MKAAKDMKKDAGVKIITLCLIGNVFLLALKGTVGFWTGSEALKADAINSAGDVLSAVVVLLGLDMRSNRGIKIIITATARWKRCFIRCGADGDCRYRIYRL